MFKPVTASRMGLKKGDCYVIDVFCEFVVEFVVEFVLSANHLYDGWHLIGSNKQNRLKLYEFI